MGCSTDTWSSRYWAQCNPFHSSWKLNLVSCRGEFWLSSKLKIIFLNEILYPHFILTSFLCWESWSSFHVSGDRDRTLLYISIYKYKAVGQSLHVNRMFPVGAWFSAAFEEEMTWAELGYRLMESRACMGHGRNVIRRYIVAVGGGYM